MTATLILVGLVSFIVGWVVGFVTAVLLSAAAMQTHLEEQSRRTSDG